LDEPWTRYNIAPKNHPTKAEKGCNVRCTFPCHRILRYRSNGIFVCVDFKTHATRFMGATNAMTAVEALDILEAAVLECKKRDVGTPEPSASMFFPRRSMPRARSSPLRVPPARGSTADHSAHETFEGPALATSTNKALAARLEKNTADGAIAASMVIAQGLADVTVPKYLKPQPH
jgi:hypothetical protein